MKTKWPPGAAICRHLYWGIVELCGVEKYPAEVYPIELSHRWPVYSFTLRTQIEALTPLTPAARAMLAIAKAGK